MVHRIIYIAIGLLVILSGIDVYNRGAFFYYGIDTELGNSKVAVSLVIIAFGISFIWVALRKGFSIFKKDHYYKCIDCENVIGLSTKEEIKCPKCSGEMIDLKEFYDNSSILKENK